MFQTTKLRILHYFIEIEHENRCTNESRTRHRDTLSAQ